MKKCVSCGYTSDNEKATFCSKCGSEMVSANKSVMLHSKRNTVFIALVICAGLLAWGIIAIVNALEQRREIVSVFEYNNKLYISVIEGLSKERNMYTMSLTGGDYKLFAQGIAIDSRNFGNDGGNSIPLIYDNKLYATEYTGNSSTENGVLVDLHNGGFLMIDNSSNYSYDTRARGDYYNGTFFHTDKYFILEYYNPFTGAEGSYSNTYFNDTQLDDDSEIYISSCFVQNNTVYAIVHTKNTSDTNIASGYLKDGNVYLWTDGYWYGWQDDGFVYKYYYYVNAGINPKYALGFESYHNNHYAATADNSIIFREGYIKDMWSFTKETVTTFINDWGYDDFDCITENILEVRYDKYNFSDSYIHNGKIYCWSKKTIYIYNTHSGIMTKYYSTGNREDGFVAVTVQPDSFTSEGTPLYNLTDKPESGTSGYMHTDNSQPATQINGMNNEQTEYILSLTPQAQDTHSTMVDVAIEPTNPRKIYFYDTYNQLGNDPSIMWGDLYWEGWADVKRPLVREADGWYSFELATEVFSDAYTMIIVYNGLPDSDVNAIQWVLWRLDNGYDFYANSEWGGKYFIADYSNPVNPPEEFFYGTQRNATQFMTKEAANVALGIN